jgi:hypothetical protein
MVCSCNLLLHSTCGTFIGEKHSGSVKKSASVG